MGCCISSPVPVANSCTVVCDPVSDIPPPSPHKLVVHPADSESDAPLPPQIEELTVAIFGLDNAGKSCFLRSLCGDFNFDTVPSVGRVEKSFAHDDTRVKIYDIGGGASFRSVWSRWYAEIWGFVYVIDSADGNRFEESSKVLKGILEHAMMKYKPFVVVANKQDVEGALSASDVKRTFNLREDVAVFEVSVITTEGQNCVEEAVSELVDEIKRRWPKIAKKQKRDMEEQARVDEEEHRAKLERIQKRREREQESTK